MSSEGGCDICGQAPANYMVQFSVRQTRFNEVKSSIHWTCKTCRSCAPKLTKALEEAVETEKQNVMDRVADDQPPI